MDGVPANTKHTLNFTPTGGAAPVALEIDYAGITQYSGDSSTLLNEPNGNAAGMFNGTSIAANGSIIANYTNGQSQVVGTIAGENTIFIAVRDAKAQRTALKQIWEMFEVAGER